MKRGQRKVIGVCAVAIVAGLLIWPYWHRQAAVTKDTSSKQSAPSSQGVSTPAPDASMSPRSTITIPSEAEIEQRDEQQWSALFLTPIAVYGKVVDENGNPVSGASVEVHIND